MDYIKLGYQKVNAACFIVQAHPEYEDEAEDTCDLYINEGEIYLDSEVSFIPYDQARGIYTLEVKFDPASNKPDFILNVNHDEIVDELDDITGFTLIKDEKYQELKAFLQYQNLDKKVEAKKIKVTSKSKI